MKNKNNTSRLFRPLGALLFYSNVPGSGNSNVYVLTLPKDPPNLPKQDGTGGTFNFQLSTQPSGLAWRCAIASPRQTPVNHARPK
jgi:hypothetical protein